MGAAVSCADRSRFQQITRPRRLSSVAVIPNRPTMVAIAFGRAKHARALQRRGPKSDGFPARAIHPIVASAHVPMPLSGRFPRIHSTVPISIRAVHSLICAAVSRALLRLTAKQQPGRALQHGGLLLPLRGRERFRLPRHPADRRSRSASRLLGSPPEKADLGFGSGLARSFVPRETSEQKRKNLNMFVNRATLIGLFRKNSLPGR